MIIFSFLLYDKKTDRHLPTMMQVHKEKDRPDTSESRTWVYSSAKRADIQLRCFEYRESRTLKRILRDSRQLIIDRVGGIDIELTSAEAAYINKRNHTSIVAGLNHLNGAEALTYTRARKIDSDFGRTERQRKVLLAMYEQAKNLSVTELLGLMYNVRSYITTDLTDSEILSLLYRLLPLASSISINSYTVPADDCYYYASIRGMSVLVPDLPRIRQCLEEYLPLE